MKKGYRCTHCGSEDILCDAYAKWNIESQKWELYNVFQQEYCEQCEGECSTDEFQIKQEKTQ